MTPEEILHKHVDKESMDEFSENVWPDIVDAMKEYALHIAQEAVEEEAEFPDSMPDDMWDIIKSDRHLCEMSFRLAAKQTKCYILSRIEKLTEEK